MSYIKLYHYVHCPFCVRIRMVLGFLDQNYESIVLSYDDEKTPINLMGVKMLPIVEFSDSSVSNESLDIIKELDSNNKLSTLSVLENISSLNTLLAELGDNVHSLAMPYWIWTKEFTDSSRAYFLKKKEKKRGPFKELVKNKHLYITKLNETIEKKISGKLAPYYESSILTLKDILLASHLWGMYIVPEFQFSDQIHAYLQNISKLCNFTYHKDYWE